jgi:TRAP transporter 4TM/12TM fusion protein
MLSNGHPYDKIMRLIGLTACAFIAAFTFYTILAGQFTAQVQRGIFLLASGVAVFTLKPFRKDWVDSTPGRQWADRFITLFFMGLLTFSVVYLFFNYFEISVSREGIPNSWDLICYTAGAVTVLEGVRRTDGWPLLTVILLVVLHLFWGHHIPGLLGHHKMSYTEILEMCFSLSGVFGIALAVVANVVFIFILFGAILRITGAGEIFIDLAYMLTGRYVGGPAQCAVVASAFFGSINGSGPANVVSTGAFTIPLMKRTGFKPEFAGAVEATASCVGQIMPPIMGVGVFIMSEITGIEYGRIMIAAIIPALLYSFSLLVNVRFQAAKLNLSAVDRNEIPRFTRSLIPRLVVIGLAILVILYQILTGRTPSMAGLSGAFVVFGASFFVKEMRPDIKKIVAMLVEGGKDGVGLIISCAGIGIIIGGLSATGVGVKFSQAIIGLGQAHLPLALIMTAICCLLLGMGLPTAASYLMVVFIAAPAMSQLGLPVLTAHLFIFYFAVMSAITPPVAVCAYAAAGISQSSPMKTGILAVRLGTVGFLLPFLWIYNPELTLSGAGFFQTVWVTLSCSLAVIALAAGNIGFLRRPLFFSERLIFFGIAFGLASHMYLMQTAALGIGVFIYFKALKSNPEMSLDAGADRL